MKRRTPGNFPEAVRELLRSRKAEDVAADDLRVVRGTLTEQRGHIAELQVTASRLSELASTRLIALDKAETRALAAEHTVRTLEEEAKWSRQVIADLSAALRGVAFRETP